MKNTKMVTVIVNRTQQELLLLVGNLNSVAKLARIVDGGEYKVEVDVNWTYQEFFLEPANADPVQKKMIILSSDDCCDFERVTVTISDGNFQLEKVARGGSTNYVAVGHRPAGASNSKSVFTWPSAWLKSKWNYWFGSA